MKKAIGQIHLWLGLASGLVVFIVSLTGCIYVFEEELSSISYHNRREVAVAPGAVKKPLSELLQIAEKELGEDHPVQAIEIPTTPGETYKFRPVQVRDKKAYTHFGEIVYQRKLYIDPYTGEVVENENTKYEFFTLVLRLHRNLLLNRETGTTIVGVSVLIFVVMLISGIVLWWPKNKRSIKSRISFEWKKTTRWKRKNYDLHNVPGFYSLFILLIIALTGLVWSFEWFDHSVQWVANGGSKPAKQKALLSDTTKTSTVLPIDIIYADLAAINPDALVFNINLPDKAKGAVNASARHEVHANYQVIRYQFDQYTGRRLGTTTFAQKSGGEKLRAMNYDIHTGSILGLPGKFLAFFASLISASLPITGFLIWYARKNKKPINRPGPAARRTAGRPARKVATHLPIEAEIEH
jgi:uncharacterized iron-regulated membrane protein